MELTLSQGLLMALVGFVCSFDQQTEALYWFRPIVAAFFTGIVLGDVQLGIACGAVSELAYLGLTMVGGNVPPDPLFAGVMTVVIAYTTGQSAEAALGLSYPFALLAQAVGILFYTVYSFVPERLDGYAKAADERGFARFLISTAIVKSLVFALLLFLCTYALQGPIQSFVSAFPTWVIHGFEVAGGVLPAVGLGMLLITMLKKETYPYLFLGFLMATFLVMPNVLPVAIAGADIAAINYAYEKRMDGASKSASMSAAEGAESNGI